MQLIIYRGTKEIGGSCLELNDNGKRILFDIGLPLDSEINDNVEKLDIQGLWDGDKPDVAGVFITHAHLDHFGLLEFVNSVIPIYMSETTYNIIKNIYPLTHEKDLSALNLNIISEEIEIGNFKIRPHQVDHSIAGSLAYEISINNKKILYTGDLRFSGRRAYLSKNLSKIKDIDYLIMEGSTLGRADQTQKSEDELAQELISCFKSSKLNLITFFAQNLDRFISVYKACLSSKKVLVIDPYSCYILENFKHLSKNIPQFDWNNIRIYFSPNSITRKLADNKILYKYKKKKISFEEICKTPCKFVIKDNFAITKKVLENFSPCDIQYIYSLWSGYLEQSSHIDILKPQLIHLHTSGHANIESLKQFVQDVLPKTIIPIHTQHPDLYESIFNTNVKLLNDNEILEIE